MAETVAFTECLGCHKPNLAVKVNRSGKAYATCDHCGLKIQHTWQRTSDAYVAEISGAAPAPAAPAASPKPAPAAAPTAPKPAPAAPKVPPTTPTPKPAAPAPAARGSLLI